MIKIEELVAIIERANVIAKDLSNKKFLTYTKEDDSPVTTVDLEINKFLTNELRALSSSISILSEETVDNLERLNTDKLFIIDPIDGTTELFSDNREFAINLAYVENKKVVKAVIGIPAYDIVYFAEINHGAYKKTNNNVTQIFVSSREEGEIHLALSRSHSSIEEINLSKEKIFSITKKIGSSYKLCLVAEGIVDASVKFSSGTKEWDVAPADLIIKEAGGEFSDIFGNDYLYNKENVRHYHGYLAVNSKKNKEILIKTIQNTNKSKKN